MSLNNDISVTAKLVGVALSGGVDSATAAHLLQRAGYDLIGFHMHLTKEGTGCSRTCCSLASVEDARRVANHLGIPFYVLNMEEHFMREVVEPSRAAYRAGRTPNPCILCNKNLKFKYLLRKAEELGCEALATGHYVRTIDEAGMGEFSLRCGVDSEKDQSYFLYFLNQELIRKLFFPLGWFSKEGTRMMAGNAGLNVASKPDSQDICFRLIDDAKVSGDVGDVIDEEGNILGRHQGVQHYTVGQRKGLHISTGYPLYVKEIVPNSQLVIVAPDDRILAKGLIAGDVSFVSRYGKDKIKLHNNMINVKVRYRSEPASAKATFRTEGTAELEFIRPIRAVCPGQAVVFYLDDEVLGGGTIDKAIY
jgi:tRNA-specific 2-thiouridylase